MSEPYDEVILDALHWCRLGNVYPADPNAFDRAKDLGLLDAHPWTTTAAGELALATQRPDEYGKRPLAIACPKCKAEPLQLCVGRVPKGEIVHASRESAGRPNNWPVAVSSVPATGTGRGA